MAEIQEISPADSDNSEDHDQGSYTIREISHQSSMAAIQEISPADSHNSEEHDQGSSTLRAPSFSQGYLQSVSGEIQQSSRSAASSFPIADDFMGLMTRNERDAFMQTILQYFVGVFLICLAVKMLVELSPHTRGRKFIVRTLEEAYLLVTIRSTYLGGLVLCMLMEWLWHTTRSKCFGHMTYGRAVVVVLEAYALLLLVNVRYIRAAIIPFIILIFIGALWVKFWKSARCEYGYNALGSMNSMEQMKLQLISQSLQLLFATITLYMGKEDKMFIISHFLLFFSTALNALAVMFASVPVAVSPGVVNVVPILQKVCIVVLLVTVHTNAAEWLGKDIVFACMPELATVLVWFTIHYDHAGHAIGIHNVTSRKSDFIVLSTVMVIVAILYAFEHSDDWNSIHNRAFYVTCFSSALTYLSAWMLNRWPEGLSDSFGPIKLLKFAAKIGFCAIFIMAAMEVFMLSFMTAEPFIMLWVIANVVIICLYMWQFKFGKATINEDHAQSGSDKFSESIAAPLSNRSRWPRRPWMLRRPWIMVN